MIGLILGYAALNTLEALQGDPPPRRGFFDDLGAELPICVRPPDIDRRKRASERHRRATQRYITDAERAEDAVLRRADERARDISRAEYEKRELESRTDLNIRTWKVFWICFWCSPLTLVVGAIVSFVAELNGAGHDDSTSAMGYGMLVSFGIMLIWAAISVLSEPIENIRPYLKEPAYAQLNTEQQVRSERREIIKRLRAAGQSPSSPLSQKVLCPLCPLKEIL